jgi:hypothetical protein
VLCVVFCVSVCGLYVFWRFLSPFCLWILLGSLSDCTCSFAYVRDVGFYWFAGLLVVFVSTYMSVSHAPLEQVDIDRYNIYLRPE